MEDRRIKRTKRFLSMALVELLAEKPVNEITVKELTERSDVNRATFYRHYRDIYDMLRQMEQELFKIDSYANLVLQYLRLESFHDDLVLRRVSVEDLVKEVVRKYALFFIQKNLTVDLHDLEQEVITDRKWLLVIIEQLLSNSLKYTSTGGIEIYFKDQTLYIKDSGIGIKNSDVLRVFERGFSGYNGHLTQQSSGLGLYLSKKIAEQLGYRITLHSEVGQGTTVAIRFEEKKLVMD